MVKAENKEHKEATNKKRGKERRNEREIRAKEKIWREENGKERNKVKLMNKKESCINSKENGKDDEQKQTRRNTLKKQKNKGNNRFMNKWM